MGPYEGKIHDAWGDQVSGPKLKEWGEKKRDKSYILGNQNKRKPMSRNVRKKKGQPLRRETLERKEKRGKKERNLKNRIGVSQTRVRGGPGFDTNSRGAYYRSKGKGEKQKTGP